MEIKEKLKLQYLAADGPVGEESGAADRSVAKEYGATHERVSTPDQEDGTSLTFQREKNLANADAHGVTVKPEHRISEVWSAADPDRPGMLKLWDLVERREIQHIFAYEPDRLYRDPWHGVRFVRHCKDHGVILHFADGTTVESVLDEAIQYLKGFVGHQEREKIAARTMDGKVSTAKANRMPNGCGRGMYGYDYDAHTHTRSVNEPEAAVVRQVFEWRLSGVSCCEIARRLNRLGIPSKTGGTWSPGTVRTMLRNEAYTGVQWWGKNRYEKVFGKGGNGKRKVTPKPCEEWIRLEGFSQVIIEPAIFQAVQTAMDRNPRRGKQWDYALTDFFSCGECGSSVCGATQTAGKYRSSDYPYYRCSGTLGDHFRPRVCNLKSMRGDKLEPAVFDRIKAVVRDPSGIIEDLRQISVDGGANLDQRISHLKGQVKKHRLELATLTMQRTREIIDQEMYESLSAPMNNLMAQLAKDIAALEEQKVLAEGWEQFEERVRVALSQYAESLDTLDAEGMQRLMRLLGVRLVAGPGRVLVTGVLDPSLFTRTEFRPPEEASPLTRLRLGRRYCSTGSLNPHGGGPRI